MAKEAVFTVRAITPGFRALPVVAGFKTAPTATFVPVRLKAIFKITPETKVVSR